MNRDAICGVSFLFVVSLLLSGCFGGAPRAGVNIPVEVNATPAIGGAESDKQREVCEQEFEAPPAYEGINYIEIAIERSSQPNDAGAQSRALERAKFQLLSRLCVRHSGTHPDYQRNCIAHYKGPDKIVNWFSKQGKGGYCAMAAIHDHHVEDWKKANSSEGIRKGVEDSQIKLLERFENPSDYLIAVSVPEDETADNPARPKWFRSRVEEALSNKGFRIASVGDEEIEGHPDGVDIVVRGRITPSQSEGLLMLNADWSGEYIAKTGSIAERVPAGEFRIMSHLTPLGDLPLELEPWGWTAVVSGSGLIIGGIIFHIVGEIEKGKISEDDDFSVATIKNNRSNRLHTAGFVTWGVGAGTLITGIVLLLADEEEELSSGSIVVDEDKMMLLYQGQF